MKFYCSIFLLLFSSSLYAQNFEDDFSDGDFTNNPAWSGADSNFVIFDLDGNNVLRLNADQAGSSYLSTSSTGIEGEWEFFIRLDFSPSNNNFTRIFLMSDIADLSGLVNGYALRWGENLSGDVFRLFKITNGIEDGEVLTGTTNVSTSGEYRLKVTRDASGNWSLEVAEGYLGTLAEEATGTDNTYSSSSFFGVQATYTASNTSNFYFDFKIDPPPVVIDPLVVDSFTRFSQTEIDLSFSRDIDFASVSTTDFLLNESVNPQSFSTQGTNALRITFSDVFPGGENELFVSGIESSTNDTSLTDTTFTFFTFDAFETGDVIINEFLKDPPTGSGLSEYIELRNTTSKYINLKDWEIGDNNSLIAISNEDQVILPDSFLVVTPNPSALTTTFGEGVYIDVSLPALNNTTDQVRMYDENGVLVDSLEYTPEWGGVDVAIERITPDLASTLQANWGDSPNAVGTPGRTNQIESDTTAPDLESYEFLNDSTLLLVFSEEIKQEPAENPDNYEIQILVKVNPDAESGENEYVRSTFFAPDTVLLEFDRPYYSYKFGNILEIRNQEDIFGNVAELISFNYELVRTSEAVPGDIMINEFMYDPASGYSEFIEINSHTGKTINLKGWTISDNTGNHQVISDQNFYVQRYPDQVSPVVLKQYVVLVPDSTIALSNSIRLVLGSRFPTLNNTTDAIVLKNADGVTIDSLTYSNSWGGSEVSLERRTVDVQGTIQANWGDSPSSNFATPGQTNEIEPDTEAPFVESILITDPETVLLKFSEELIDTFAVDPDNYIISPTQIASEIEVSSDSVKITLSQALSDGEQLSIEVLNQRDIFGNVNESELVEAFYFEITPAIRNEVVINEILYRRKDELSPEFVELFNPTSKNFDLSGWELIDAGNNTGDIPDGTFLPSGQYLILTDREDFANTAGNAIYLPDFPSLNDSDDGVIIKNADGFTIDSLFYQSAWGGNSPGISLERKDPGRASNDASNWATSTAQGGFSAGSESSVFEEDETAPEIIFASESEFSVFIAFSEFINITPETRFLIRSVPATVLEFNTENANQLILNLPEDAISSGDEVMIEFDVSIENLEDVKGNVNSESSLLIARRLTQNAIVINEIMYDPLADSEDNLPDQTEYIELYNRSNSAVSLEGIFLHDEPDEENEIRSITPVSTQYKWIQPGGYFLMYSEDEASNFAESKTARYFSMEEESDQFTMLVDRSSLSLASSDDAIYLADSMGTTIDSVFFDESWQNPNIFDTDGIALERIDPNGPGNSASNWSSSTHPSGGTPNDENTIFQEPGAAPESVGISFSPNPFSPDDDGFEDNLFINYTLDAPDYLLRVRIFDRYGRQVRELANNQQAGFEGSLIWDGLTDDRRKNRVGIYIVLFEAYNSANGSDRTFKETVVLARMF